MEAGNFKEETSMSFAFFINEEYLKENTPIDNSVDSKLLRTAMREAQDIYIRDLIGSGIYNDLITQIIGASLTTDYTTLLNEYIAPCMKYYVLYESAHTISFQILNKGISTRNSEHQTPADINSITALMAKWKDRAEYYGERLKKYLQANINLYPKFTNAGATIDTIHPQQTNLYSGFYLGGTGNECPRENEPD